MKTALHSWYPEQLEAEKMFFLPTYLFESNKNKRNDLQRFVIVRCLYLFLEIKNTKLFFLCFNGADIFIRAYLNSSFELAS